MVMQKKKEKRKIILIKLVQLVTQGFVKEDNIILGVKS